MLLFIQVFQNNRSFPTLVEAKKTSFSAIGAECYVKWSV